MATLTPQTTEWIATAPIQIEKSIMIEAPAAKVWAQLAHNPGWTKWFPGCRECRFTSDAPHGVDSLRFVHMDQFKVSERITVWEPNHQWGMTVLEINAPVLAAMAEEAVLSESNGVTTIDFRIGVELTRLGRLARRPLVAKQAKSLETALANLASRTTGQLDAAERSSD